MHDSKCNMNELFIEQFADGEVDFKESAEISAHLEVCPECNKKYQEIRFVKNVISNYKAKEVLSVIEKEGFCSLIDRFDKSLSSFQKLTNFLKSQGFIVGFSFFSFASFLFLFSYFIFKSDEKNGLIIKEIISAYNNSLPDEFSGSEKTEAELGKNFKLDKNMMKKLAAISPVVRGRFTSIASKSVAKINLEGLENDKGTLFLSKKNEHLKKLFKDKDCIVETAENDCKARTFKEKDTDLVYWENKDNDYVLVTDNSKMLARMVELISAD